MIATYQADVSGRITSRCSLTPSCSEYGRLCFERYSFPGAAWRTVRRMHRCSSRARAERRPVEVADRGGR